MKLESIIPKKYEITKVEKNSEDVNLYRVNYKENPSPGTFIEVGIPGTGESPITTCSYSKDHLDLLIKNAGKVTNEIFKLKKGDSIWIRGPYGTGFPISDLKGKTLIMIAGGTGVATLASMIEYVEENRSDFEEIIIYFSFRNDENILLDKKIDRWEKKFNMHIGLSRDKDPEEYEKGKLTEIIDRHKPDTENSMVLICGPEGLMKVATDKLNELGVPNRNIFWSMERRMECAIGECGRCQLQELYVCEDGPIIRYDIVKPRLENEIYSEEKGK
jgi:anaerobic sulfite reductase subunit B